MFELALLIALVALVVAALRGGQAGSNNPLVLSLPDHYHFTLSSQLACVQPFLHLIVERATNIARTASDAPTLFFHVRDIVLHDGEYLLAIALRQHTLYIQAINQAANLTSDQARYAAVEAFSGAVMIHHPFVAQADEVVINQLADTVQAVAIETGRGVQRLLPPTLIESGN
ncbi:MAG: hypothetical protein PHY62_10780 [Gallionella sp.]|nr:hypothetical protein [Gallionella sp.]